MTEEEKNEVIDDIIKKANEAYPENTSRDIDGDYYDSNRWRRQAWAEGYAKAMKEFGKL